MNIILNIPELNINEEIEIDNELWKLIKEKCKELNITEEKALSNLIYNTLYNIENE